MNKLFLYILLSGFISLNISCKEMKKDKEETRFSWTPTACAPELYPVRVVRGAFYKGENRLVSVPNGRFLDNGWGNTGSDYSTAKQLPDGLGIEWFSFTENKFYTGSFDLAYDTIKKLFNEGLTSYLYKKHETYNYISVGMATGGVVVVWLIGGGGKTVEVGRYQAKETTRDLNEFMASSNIWYDWEDRQAAQNDFSERNINKSRKVVDNLNNKGFQYDLWDTYREKFNIRVRPVYEDSTCITDEIKVKYYNGEGEMYSLERLQDTSFAPKPRIKYVDVLWSFGRTMKYVEIEINEDEIFKAYKLIYEDNPMQEVELRVDVNEDNNYVRVYLSALGLEYPKELELTKGYVRIFPMPEIERYRYTIFKDEFK